MGTTWSSRSLRARARHHRDGHNPRPEGWSTWPRSESRRTTVVGAPYHEAGTRPPGRSGSGIDGGWKPRGNAGGVPPALPRCPSGPLAHLGAALERPTPLCGVTVRASTDVVTRARELRLSRWVERARGRVALGLLLGLRVGPRWVGLAVGSARVGCVGGCGRWRLSNSFPTGLFGGGGG